MSIKIRLILLSLLFTLVIGGTCALTMVSSQSIRKEIDYSNDISLIVRNVFELNIITYQYLLYSEERMKQQWLMKYKSFGELLDQLEAISKPVISHSVAKIQSGYEPLYDLFHKLQENHERRKDLLRSNGPKAEIDRTIVVEKRLVAQLLMKAQEIVIDAYELSNIMKNEITGLQEKTQVIMLFSTVVFILLTIGILFFTIKGITVPMSQLIEGVKIIGAGNLEHKLSVESKNEIGQLSRAFDKMIAELKNLTISRDQLDQRVKERTIELEAANTELSQYAYVVSHDLKAPLRAIHNYSDFLREDLEGKLDGDQKKYLDGLNRAVRQGEELVNDLLMLSRIGKSDDAPETVDIGPFIRELSESMNLPGNVKLEIDDGLPAVNTDRLLLTQIFRNLIDNAVKFNSSQVKCVHIGCSKSGGGCLEIFVKDSGIGIEDRFFDKIFQVFQRLHTRNEYEGTGIGLAIVKKATEKLSGRIRVESEPGSGSTFFIHIPFAQKGENR